MYKESPIAVYWWKHENTENDLRVNVDHYIAYTLESTTTLKIQRATAITFTILQLCIPNLFLLDVQYTNIDQRKADLTYLLTCLLTYLLTYLHKNLLYAINVISLYIDSSLDFILVVI
jgi:hypothetical protein